VGCGLKEQKNKERTRDLKNMKTGEQENKWKGKIKKKFFLLSFPSSTALVTLCDA
jgi:hypothetical protein